MAKIRSGLAILTLDSELRPTYFRIGRIEYTGYPRRDARVLGKGNKVRILYLNEACQDALNRYLAVRRPLAVEMPMPCFSLPETSASAVLMCTRW